MLTLMDNKLAGCALKVVRSKLRSPSITCSKLLDNSKSRNHDDQCQGRSKTTGAAGGVHKVGKSASLQVQPTVQPAVSGLPHRTKVTDKTTKDEDPQKNVPPPVVPREMDAFLHARSFENIPGPTSLPQSIPFAGTRLLYYPFTNYKMDNRGDMLTKLQAIYGPTFRVKIGANWTVLIENINDIEHVVRAAEQEEGRGIARHQPPPFFLKGPLEKLAKRNEDQALAWLNLTDISPSEAITHVSHLSSHSGRWLDVKLRTAVSHILNSSSTVGQYLEGQEIIAVDFTNELDHLQESPLDVHNLFYRYAFESVGKVCFNQRLGMLSEHYFSDGEKQKLVESYRTLVRSMGEHLTGTRVLHHFFEVPFVKRFREAFNVVTTWERKMIREGTMSAIREKGISTLEPSERSVLMSLMDDKSITEDEIADAILTLMTSGVEMIGCALQMTLYCLATNIDKQEKVYKELVEVLGPDFKLTPNSIKSMDYLKAAVKESMRLQFPLASGGRVVLSSNIVLSNYLVPAGTQIVVNSRRCAKNPIWFDHPHYFIPERWIGDAANNIPNLAYLPFGFGSNLSPVRSFVLQEIHTAVIKILLRFRVELPPDYQNGRMETVYTPFRRPKEPLPFFFMPRPYPLTAKPTKP